MFEKTNTNKYLLLKIRIYEKISFSNIGFTCFSGM